MTVEQKIHELLAVHGAVLKRRKKHEVWQLPNGKTFVKASTPSDTRSAKNSLRDLRKVLELNDTAELYPGGGEVQLGGGDGILDAPQPIESQAKCEEREPLPVPADFAKPLAEETQQGESTMNYRVEYMLITPGQAKSFLELNSHNRKLSTSTVERYAADMASNLWRDNAQPIIFSRDNVLLDGQHRLAAVVKSGMPQRMLVVSDADPSIMDSIDIGKGRSAGDALRLDGVKYYSNVPAVGRLVMAYELKDYTFGKSDRNVQSLLSVPRVATYVREHHDELEQSCVATSPMWSKFGGSSYISASYAILARIDKERVGEFFAAFSSGADLSEFSPIFRLRERLRDNKNSRAKLPPSDFIALIFKAWNLWINGSTCQALSFRKGEAFPVPQSAKTEKPIRTMPLRSKANGVAAHQ